MRLTQSQGFKQRFPHPLRVDGFGVRADMPPRRETQKTAGRRSSPAPALARACFPLSGFGFCISCFGHRVSRIAFRVSGFGFRVSGSGLSISRVKGGTGRQPRGAQAIKSPPPPSSSTPAPLPHHPPHPTSPPQHVQKAPPPPRPPLTPPPRRSPPRGPRERRHSPRRDTPQGSASYRDRGTPPLSSSPCPPPNPPPPWTCVNAPHPVDHTQWSTLTPSHPSTPRHLM